MMPRVSNKSMMPNFIHVVYDGVRYRAPSDEKRMEEWIVVNVWPRERVGFRVEWDRAKMEAIDSAQGA